PQATAVPSGTAAPATPPEAANQPETPPAPIYPTVMTGSELKTIEVGVDEFRNYEIRFTLTDKGRQIFADYSSTHIGQFLGIVLDKEVISAPRIETPITEGSGRITGKFTAEEANALAIQLRYGSLPVPLKIVETRIIGPTLGEDSLQKSLIAGVVGMIIVILFMALYYRLPGIVADISILFYAAIAFAIFKYFHFTLTLPGIAGFMLSTGAALDANILIFERLKEELRSGRTLAQAVEQGWKRAWPSIRDSNIAAIITSVILFWFGSTFGATIVKGFSLTLAIGVIVSLFTAIFVTRTLLALVLQWFKPKNYSRWFGL
ncbi:MAG: protein translocase subunit SecD, partial [Anaerolineales bacterium]|nr:protein translocase subunit SecD [Anaerolineales bacterium]